MAKADAKAFFTRGTMRFLQELANHNDREWFGANKHRYESLVLEPALEFIDSMGPIISRISDYFIAVPKRSGGSLMRVYRDTRFSRDKRPYKTNVGIQFRHEYGKDVHAPGFYLHVEPRQCFLGAGIWHPEPESLAKIRQKIAESAPEWRKAAYGKRFTEHLSLGGSSLVRPPKGFASDAPYIEDLKRKDFIAVGALADSAAVGPNLRAVVGDRFRRARPLMAFLCDALELPF